jgi:dienelactone hydrolase
MGDLLNRLHLFTLFGAGIALLCQHELSVSVLSWVGLFLLLIPTLLTSPAIRVDAHWRSLGAYLFNIILAILCFCNIGSSGIFSFPFCVAYGIILVLVCLVTALLYVVFPMPSNYLLTGKNRNIGTFSFNLDIKVIENDKHPNSQITVQCWFPITQPQNYWAALFGFRNKALLWTSGHPEYQIKENLELFDLLTKSNKFPSIVMKHMLQARSHSVWSKDFYGIKVATSCGESTHKLPIAIYSHGMHGWRQIHHSACENLASNGFIVFACDHTPDSTCSRLLGGTGTGFAFPTPPNLLPDVERAFYREGMERRINQLEHMIGYIKSEEFSTRFVNIKGKIDCNHVNLWGHSYGGGTIAALCCRDSSINSAVMLDGWMYPVPDADRRRGSQGAALLNISAELWPYGKVKHYAALLRS